MAVPLISQRVHVDPLCTRGDPGGCTRHYEMTIFGSFSPFSLVLAVSASVE